ncbi:MAG: hypothetical protein KDK08_02825 [Rhizobiaceae bacterium]|nr:hypothetical protein [Rhizobiaceae bacterium]
MTIDLEKIWNEDKELSVEPDWKRRAQDEFVRIVCPLDAGGITYEGLNFTASAHIYMPDRSVTFQVEFHPPRRDQRGGPISRIEWRPRSPHNNKGVGPPEHRHKPIVGCHVHPFGLNWNHSASQVRKGNLPIAIPINPGFGSYEEALEYVEKEFRINGVRSLPPPPWTRKLI